MALKPSAVLATSIGLSPVLGWQQILVVKNLGRGMHESFIRQEQEYVGIHVKGSRSCVRADVNRTPQCSAPNPNSLSLERGPEVSRVRSITELCGIRVSVESYVAAKGPLQCKALPALRTHVAKLWMRASVPRVWRLPLLRMMFNPARASSLLWLRG